MYHGVCQLSFVQERDFDVDDFIPQFPRQVLQRVLTCLFHRLVRSIEPLLKHAQNLPPRSISLSRLWRNPQPPVSIPLIRLRHDPIRHLQIHHIRSNRTANTITPRQIRSRPDTDPSRARLQPEHPAVIRRDADTASAIVADGEGDEAGADSVRAPAAAAAGVVRGVVGVGRGAVVRVVVRCVQA